MCLWHVCATVMCVAAVFGCSVCGGSVCVVFVASVCNYNVGGRSVWLQCLGWLWLCLG